MLSILVKSPSMEELRSFLHETGFSAVPLDEYIHKIMSHATFITMRDGNGNLQGLSVTYMNRPEHDFAYLTYIALRPDVRGQGYSKKLLGTTMNLAKEHEFRCFRLEVNRQNGIARHLYESFGFLPFDETDRSIYMKCML